MNDKNIQFQPSTFSDDETTPEGPLAPTSHELSGWVAKYVLAPLTPFIIGATIRMLVAEEFSNSSFDPGELAFSLAMFCLFVLLSVHRHRGLIEPVKDRIKSVFTLSMVLYISMFAVSIYNSSIMSEYRKDHSNYIKESLIEKMSSPPTLKLSKDEAKAELDKNSHFIYMKKGDRVSNKVLILVGASGILIVLVGMFFQYNYGLDDQ